MRSVSPKQLSEVVRRLCPTLTDDQFAELLVSLEAVRLFHDATEEHNRPPRADIARIAKTVPQLAEALRNPLVVTLLAGPLQRQMAERPRAAFRDENVNLEELRATLDDLATASARVASQLSRYRRAWPRSGRDRAIGDLGRIGTEIGIKPEVHRKGHPEGPIIEFIEAALDYLGLSIGRESILKSYYANKRAAL